jgi:formylmethanofuran dehydrogenase subunit C
MAPYQSKEKGQAIVLITLAIIALLGFTALAVDGSMLYADRRFTQSGTDSSSQAGGATAIQWFGNKGITYSNFGVSGTSCTGDTLVVANKAIQAAIKRAGENSLVVDNDINDNNGVRVECGTDPITAPKAGGGSVVLFNDRYMDIITTATKQTSTAFLHFVYQGAAQNITTSVTRVRPTQPLVYGFAVVALNPNACSGNSNGIQMRGSLTFFVQGGGVFSNGCLDVDGGNQPIVKNGSVLYFNPGNSLSNIKFQDQNGNWITSNKPIGQLASNAPKIPTSAYDIPVPQGCTANPTPAGVHKGSDSIIDGKSGLSGLYCITGDAKIKDGFSGTNMTIVMMGGKLTINGNATVSIEAPGPGYTGDAIPGVALYMPTQFYGPMPGSCGENQELKINGGSISKWVGTLLAPCTDVSLEGNGNTKAYQAQVIGWNVNSGGNADLYVVYNGGVNAQRPALMDMWR